MHYGGRRYIRLSTSVTADLTQNQKADMNTYETPTITELGSVADFTRQDGWDIDFDGRLAHDRNGVPGPFGGGGS